MENTISFTEWATKWWQENGKMKNDIRKNDVDELGRRLRKAIDAVFGFEDYEKVDDMYDVVEINDIYPDMVTPLGLEREQLNLSVLAAVERMPKEERPEYTGKKIDRIKALEKEKKAAIIRRDRLAKEPDSDMIASERREKLNGKIERIEKDIENLKAKLLKCPLGKTPVFESVGETEGRLYDFFLKKIGRGGSVTPYSYSDIQKGYWEKVDISDRIELYELVKALYEKIDISDRGELYGLAKALYEYQKDRFIVFSADDSFDVQSGLLKFCQKIFMPQIYRCKEKVDKLSGYFENMITEKIFIDNDEFLSKLNIFNDIDRQLDILLKEAEDIHNAVMEI